MLVTALDVDGIWIVNIRYDYNCDDIQQTIIVGKYVFKKTKKLREIEILFH